METIHLTEKVLNSTINLQLFWQGGSGEKLLCSAYVQQQH